jgi:lysozyme
MKTSDAGIFALALHEGIVPGPYRDSVGVWTFGIGHTAAAGAPEPAKMPRGASGDLAKVFAVFRKDLAAYEAAVARAVTIDLEQHEFDALVSFHFNTGAIETASLVKRLNAGDRKAAAEGFMAWRKPPEIIERRQAEQHLFMTGEYPEGRVPVWGVSTSGQVIWKQQSSLGLDEVIGFLRGRPAALLSEPPSLNDRPTLRMGDRGAMVFDLQTQLKMIGQFPGKIDGIFGQMTFNAVTNVQAAANIVMDGVVGPQTWAALQTAEPPPERDVSADDLRKRGSTTVKAADAQAAAAVIGVGGVSIEAIRGALDTVQQGQGALEWLGVFVKDNWPLALVLGALAVAWFLAGRIRDERVRKAVSGADLSL